MSFFDVEFPRVVSYRAVGGAGFSTTVVPVSSGFEQRNRNWSLARSRYTVSLITPAGAVRADFAEQLRRFFLLVGGKADGFRFYDHLDHAARAETCATLTSTTFQLQKTYTLAGRSYSRPIAKPITGTLVDFAGVSIPNTLTVRVGGVIADPQPTVSAAGVLTFGSAPGGAVTADFDYHVPVRLDTDDMQMQVEESDVSDGKPIVSWNSLTLVEVRPPNF